MTTDTPSAARPSIQPFTYADAPELLESGVMEFKDVPEASIVNAKDDSLGVGLVSRVLFRDTPLEGSDRTDGLSLVHAWLAPHYQLPPHSHDGDCLYYIASGTLILGKRTLGAGDGFFVPKDSPYRYTAGPDGVEVIEFRTSIKFDYKFADSNDARWKDRYSYATNHREEWIAARDEFLKDKAPETDVAR
ncbi:cupin domain-containing protein [Agromyces albus]|uniref:Cupin domain-containing protein n=1 Tax=Agromyces albus TaxID=205332 RepID=A0A4Q2KRK7_9MICO|nr:cupin domain-containing protein [Agromyces albus]RXZ68074.1 cupin domain-containing protein [Agromyces albus]